MSWQKAMLLWFQDKVDILEAHEKQIRSVSDHFPAPAVLKMKKYIKPRKQRRVRLCRENIFLRDEYQCQFCGEEFVYRDLTLDHVMPVSRGGAKSWENLVAACRDCNRKKRNRTPREANMPLLKKPIPLRWTPKFDMYVKIKGTDKLWSPYLDYAEAMG